MARKAKTAKAPNVVCIDGGEIALPGQPCEDTISTLESLLEQARSGEIIGVAGITVYPSKEGYTVNAGNFWAGRVTNFAAVGALEDVKFILLKVLNP